MPCFQAKEMQASFSSFNYQFWFSLKLKLFIKLKGLRVFIWKSPYVFRENEIFATLILLNGKKSLIFFICFPSLWMCSFHFRFSSILLISFNISDHNILQSEWIMYCCWSLTTKVIMKICYIELLLSVLLLDHLSFTAQMALGTGT